MKKPYVRAGIYAGQIAGLIMAVAMMAVFGLFLGTSIFHPVEVIGSAIYGEDAFISSQVQAFFVGVLIHQLGPSLIWGIVYGILARAFRIVTPGEAAVLGCGVAILAMIGPYFIVPAYMFSRFGVDIWSREVPATWDWVAHFVFGLSFAYYPRILRRMENAPLYISPRDIEKEAA